jgi:hypothetical protein
MKRFVVGVVLIVSSFALPASAPEPVTTCLACVRACKGQGMNTPVCLLQCYTSGACSLP